MAAESPWGLQKHNAEMLVHQTKYLLIYQMKRTPGRKTNRYAIISKGGQDIIGWVHWYASWRQYCFFPSEGSIWNRTCLDDVSEFLLQIICEYRNGGHAEPPSGND